MDGLLLWIQSKNSFLGLGIQNGQMKFASDLLDGSGNIFEMPNGGFVSDGGKENYAKGKPRFIYLLEIVSCKVFQSLQS